MTVYELDKGTSGSGPKLGWRGIVALLGGVLTMIPIGTAYTFGNFSPYIVSYFRNRTDDTDLRNVDSLWVGMVATVSMCFGVTGGGLIERHLGPRPTIAIGGIIFSASTICSYFFVKMSFVSFTVDYGFVQNVGAKIVYGLVVQVAITWLPHRSSLAAGLVLSGYGAGALVFNQVITAYINPHNLSPDLETEDGERYFTDPDLLDRVPNCFLLLGFIFLAMQIIGTIGITGPPRVEHTEYVQTIALDQNGNTTPIPEKHLPTVSEKVQDETDNTVRGYTDYTVEVAQNGSVNDKKDNVDTKVSVEVDAQLDRNEATPSVKAVILSALRTRSFYVVCLTVFCFSMALRFVASLYKAYGQMFIHDDVFLALSGTLSSIFNSLGRPCWGMVMDKLGYRVMMQRVYLCFKGACISRATVRCISRGSATDCISDYIAVTMRCISVGFAAICATLVLTEHMHKAFFLLWICGVFAMYSGLWAVVPATFARLYGVRNTAITYAFTFISTALASIAILVVGTTLKDTIGYHGMFYISGGLGAVPFLLTFLFNGVDGDGKRI